MIEFTTETILTWCFLFWKIFSYWFNFFYRYGPIQHVYLSLCELWQTVSFKELGHFIWIIKFCSQYSFIMLLISIGLLVMILLSFLIIVICVLSLSFLFVSLPRSLSNYLIYPKMWFLFSLIFSIVFLFSIPLISSLMFIISSPLIALGLYYLCFSSFITWELNWF